MPVSVRAVIGGRSWRARGGLRLRLGGEMVASSTTPALRLP